MMSAGALIHTNYFTSVGHESKLQTNGTGKPKRTVKMMSSSYAPPMRIRIFSGLRLSNALDYNIMITTNQDFHCKDVLTTSFQRKKSSSRIVPKAMFERFNEKAIKVVMLAQEEARFLGHNFVGTEQLLLGLIREGNDIAAKVFKSRGISLKDARVEVERIIGRGSEFVAVEVPFTPRAKRVLELSIEETRKLGHNFIGTEHLLLGLLQEGEGVAARVLENLGADPSTLRTQVILMIEEGTETEGATVVGATSRNKMPTPREYGTNLSNIFSSGMKFEIIFEGEEAPNQRLTGTITGMVSCDPKKRPSYLDFLLPTSKGGSSKVTATNPSPNVQESSSRSCTKVHKEGIALGRSLELTKFKNYDELINELDNLFEFNGELKNRNKNWMILYKDTEGDMMLVGDDPWKEFCGMVSKIYIYTKDTVRGMNDI